MATSEEFPSWESLLAQGQPPELSVDILRIHWKPFGPLKTSVRVGANPRDPPSAEDQAYCQTDPTAVHPVSASSLTEPPISSITVTQDDLSTWEDDWVDGHLPHADYDGAVWAVAETDDGDCGSGGDEDNRDDELGRKLIRCCDEDRPHTPAPLVVRASTKGYLTIHDYITTVHAWLQTHHDDILRARGVQEAEQTTFYVNIVSVDRVVLDDGNRNSDFTSLWTGLASYVDRQLNGQLLSRAELLRSKQPGTPMFDDWGQAREWAMQGQSEPQKSAMALFDSLDHVSRMDVGEMLRRNGR